VTIPLLIIVALIAMQSGIQVYMAFRAYETKEYIHIRIDHLKSRTDRLEKDFYGEDDNA
jgi:hypothetical protein